MQQLETYFGFRVTLGKSITGQSYKELVSKIDGVIKETKIPRDSFKLYMCHVQIEKLPAHFDPSPLSKKVREMQVHLAINKRQRDEDRMYFINDQVKHSFANAPSSKSDRFDLKYDVPGSFFDKHDDFHEVVFVVVHSSLKTKDRRIKVKFLARPTTEFGSKLRNVQAANTQLHLSLDPRIQLRFEL